MDACPGYLPMPEAPAPDDGATACIGIAGGVSGIGADPCTPRTSLNPSDISSSRCESDFAKVCGSTRYEVICACPEGTCACLGPSTHVVSFGNCPYCPQQDQALYALCGFPYQAPLMSSGSLVSHSKRTWPLGLAVIAAGWACGSRSELFVPEKLDAVPEASLTDAPLVVEASTACTPNGRGGGGGHGDCMTWLDETCDGVDYQVSCDCPSGNCVCFGPSTHVISNPSCTGCPNVIEAFALCGFPPYPGPSMVACTSASMCSNGEVCCASLAMSTSCLPGPCPSTSFPIQLCATSTECFTQGDTCGPLTAPVAVSGITVCNGPSSEGAGSGSPSSSP
jgi:hypothetical protein